MKASMRAYQGEEDFWRVREFLRQVFLLNGRREVSWHVARLDYWRWHVIENCNEYPSIDGVTFIWELADGQIVAVMNPEGKGEAHLQLHPGLRRPQLEEEMLDVAEQHLAVRGPDGRCSLGVWVNEQDDLRQRILSRRGYVKGDWPEYQHCRTLVEPIPEIPVAAGYVVRALGDVDELPARSWASWKGFHPDEPDERYEGWTWYHSIQRMPLYRRDLDIVAVAPNGEIASFCTLWYDDVTRSAYFEPVATVREHQRRGLGKAVMFEAMRRVQRMGGMVTFVGGYSPEARALYNSVAKQYSVNEPWVKAW